MKNSFKIYFQEMEKLLPMEGIFEILKQNVFHWPEWRIHFKNTFPLDEKKTSINVWKIDKRCVARKSLSTNRNAFRNTCPLEGKIKLAVAGLSQNRKKKVSTSQKKSVSASRNKVIFQKLELPVSTNRTKIPK